MTRKLTTITASVLLACASASFPALAAKEGQGGPARGNMEENYSMDKKRSEKASRKEEGAGSEMGDKDRERDQDRERDDDDMDSDRDRDRDRDRERMHQDMDKEKPGMSKQREMKMEQEQKELGKGSEQGQESREQRRKWWRFWE